MISGYSHLDTEKCHATFALVLVAGLSIRVCLCADRCASPLCPYMQSQESKGASFRDNLVAMFLFCLTLIV